MFRFKNQRGQGLVEYVIVVALVAVACMGLVRVLQSSIKANLANVIFALQGDGKRQERGEKINSDDMKKTDFTDFMKGASSEEKN